MYLLLDYIQLHKFGRWLQMIVLWDVNLRTLRDPVCTKYSRAPVSSLRSYLISLRLTLWISTNRVWCSSPGLQKYSIKKWCLPSFSIKSCQTQPCKSWITATFSKSLLLWCVTSQVSKFFIFCWCNILDVFSLILN